jgi:hypothetical protein
LAPTSAHGSLRRSALRTGALSLALAAASPASGAEPRVEITIQDQPRFEGSRSTLGDDGTFEVSAALLDDTGAAIEGAEVVASTTAGRANLVDCHASPRPSLLRRSGALHTDAAGRVCVRVVGASREGRVQLTFTGDALHLPVSAAIGLQPAPSSASLAFDAPSLELDLDQPTLRLRLTLSGGAADEPIPAIELELHEGARQSTLAASEWSRSGDALSFTIDTAQLGAPGPARLVARRAERDRLTRAETLALRVATVELGAEVVPADGDGIDLRIWPRTRASVSPSGWVEVTRGADSQAIGSAPFEGGSARVHLAETSGEVTLVYHSDDPWWLPGEPLSLVLDPTPPRPPRRWPWLALLAPIGYVCLRSLQRPALRRPERRPPPRPRPALPVAAGSAPMSGWVGFVSDAHDGEPIASAEVRILLPSYRGDASTPVALTDERGGFQLPPLADPLPEGARLRVSAPLHSDMERALPPQGRVSIALTSRRRAVLRRLVRWARAAGAPWFRSGEPTPGEVLATATRRGDLRTARWAEDVQAAAFGTGDVDASREASLRAAEPTWNVTVQHGETRDD